MNWECPYDDDGSCPLTPNECSIWQDHQRREWYAESCNKKDPDVLKEMSDAKDAEIARLKDALRTERAKRICQTVNGPCSDCMTRAEEDLQREGHL